MFPGYNALSYAHRESRNLFVSLWAFRHEIYFGFIICHCQDECPGQLTYA